MKWWSSEGIAYYNRAAKESDFHKGLADIITPYLSKDETIAELGCGTGWMTNELRKRGYIVAGYDNDHVAIQSCKENFPDSTFFQANCYRLIKAADISLCVFFGRITMGMNFSNLMKSCKKRLIYIQNEHQDYSRCNWERTEEVELFLKAAPCHFEMGKTHLRFDQPLDSLAEFEEYKRIYYSKRVFDREYNEEKKAVIIDKAFSYFIIDKEEGCEKYFQR